MAGYGPFKKDRKIEKRRERQLNFFLWFYAFDIVRLKRNRVVYKKENRAIAPLS
jgi:hypothetical protein